MKLRKSSEVFLSYFECELPGPKGPGFQRPDKCPNTSTGSRANPSLPPPRIPLF
ncbi:MAG: hypothetical protein KGJ02_08580 [Verrucomicrobiota bacterium]|nr:hypothetical protein [Verrucomicrobiota bacterium]